MRNWILRIIRRLRFARARRRYERASAMLTASLAEVDLEMLADDEMVMVDRDAERPVPEMRPEDYPETIPCICCGKPLRDWSAGTNQPFEALELATGGHYPSAIYDDGSGELVVNICDPCLLAGAQAGRVLKRAYPEPRKRGDRAIFEPWRGPG